MNSARPNELTNNSRILRNFPIKSSDVTHIYTLSLLSMFAYRSGCTQSSSNKHLHRSLINDEKIEIKNKTTSTTDNTLRFGILRYRNYDCIFSAHESESSITWRQQQQKRLLHKEKSMPHLKNLNQYSCDELFQNMRESTNHYE